MAEKPFLSRKMGRKHGSLSERNCLYGRHSTQIWTKNSGFGSPPGLIDEKSEYYSELKSLVRTDASPMPNVHPFDLDNPEYYELLRKYSSK